jgi:hypothetical protein
MWGHYVQDFVIGFDADQEILVRHSAQRSLGKVTYTKVRPTKPRLEDFTEDEIFFTKRDAWSYEREWRTLDVQNSATSGPPSKTSYDTRMLTLNPAAVVEVICVGAGQRRVRTSKISCSGKSLNMWDSRTRNPISACMTSD